MSLLKIASTIVTLASFGMGLQAAVIVPTSAPISFSDLMGNQVQIGDKIYENFSYSQAVGASGVEANEINVTFDLASQGSIQIYEILLDAVGDTWDHDFSLSYDIKVTPLSSPWFIVASAAQGKYFSDSDSSLSLDVNTNPGAVNLVSGTFTPLDQSDLAIYFAPQKAVSVVSSFTYGGSILQSIEQDITQSAVPEPGTLALVGAGLVLAGAIRSRRA